MKFIIAFLTGSLCMIMNGLSIGWTSPYTKKFQNYFSVEKLSWIAPTATLGLMFSTILLFFYFNSLGRKKTIGGILLFYLLGWLAMTFSKNYIIIIISRFIIGIGVGICLTGVTVYMVEITSTQRRGTVCCSLMLCSKTGIVIGYYMGSILSLHQYSCVLLGLIIITGSCWFWIPESPHYLLFRGDYEKAKKSLMDIRGSTDVEEEMNSFVETVEMDLSSNIKLKDIFTQYANRKAFLIVFPVSLIKCLSGGTVLEVYAETIVEKMAPDFNASLLTLGFSICSMVGNLLAALAIDKFGRRPLLIIPGTVMTICMGVISVALYMEYINVDFHIMEITAVGCLFVFICFDSMGWLIILPLLLTELFPTSLKFKAAALNSICSELVLLVELKIFYNIFYYLNAYIGFSIFFIICFIGVINIYYIVPETKCKTFEEIQMSLQKKKGSTRSLEDSRNNCRK